MELASPLTLLIALAALGTLYAAYTRRRAWVYVFKPLTTGLILAFALLPAPLSLYQGLLAGGLIFSLAGDIFLMLSAKRFGWGLASFLVTHLCYLTAFTLRAGGFREPFGLSLPFALGAALLIRFLSPRARRLRWPVTLYILVITLMVWRAGAQWVTLGGLRPGLAFLGALLFAVSDATLAVNQFVRRYRYGQVLTLATYYLAQTLIAGSV